MMIIIDILLVDCFYMKTCAFRGAQPLRPHEEGIFAYMQEPFPRYRMIPCSRSECACCTPVHQGLKTQPWSVLDMTTTSMHHFRNRYTAYLNCPAVSSSSPKNWIRTNRSITLDRLVPRRISSMS